MGVDWREHEALIAYALYRRGKTPTDPDWDDWFQEGRVALWRAAQRWDPARGAWTTVAMVALRHAWDSRLLRAPRAAKRQAVVVALDAPALPDDGPTWAEVLAAPGDVAADGAARADAQAALRRWARWVRRQAPTDRVRLGRWARARWLGAPVRLALAEVKRVEYLLRRYRREVVACDADAVTPARSRQRGRRCGRR